MFPLVPFFRFCPVLSICYPPDCILPLIKKGAARASLFVIAFGVLLDPAMGVSNVPPPTWIDTTALKTYLWDLVCRCEWSCADSLPAGASFGAGATKTGVACLVSKSYVAVNAKSSCLCIRSARNTLIRTPSPRVKARPVRSPRKA